MKITDIKPNNANPRTIKDAKFKKLKKSISEFPKMMELRPIVIDEDGTILGGNMRYRAIVSLGYKDIPNEWVKKASELTDEEKQRFIVEDNVGFGEWDFDMLANEWDEDLLSEWGVDLQTSGNGDIVEFDNNEEELDDEYERMKKEFAEKMANGALSEDDEEYQEFIKKFEEKRTTDDCYTPDNIYECVADFVSETYGVNKTKFIRPFYPGGDYEREEYPSGCVVVDNPPFSILSDIEKFYSSRKIKYFLFAPSITIGNYTKRDGCCCICTHSEIIYENGAKVRTSFITNLDDNDFCIRNYPELNKSIKEKNAENNRKIHKQLPKYSFPSNLITSVRIGSLSNYGVEFNLKRSECFFVSKIDSMGSKGIFGGGFIISERKEAERKEAERKEAERKEAERKEAERKEAYVFELSEREKKIIKELE